MSPHGVGQGQVMLSTTYVFVWHVWPQCCPLYRNGPLTGSQRPVQWSVGYFGRLRDIAPMLFCKFVKSRRISIVIICQKSWSVWFRDVAWVRLWRYLADVLWVHSSDRKVQFIHVIMTTILPGTKPSNLGLSHVCEMGIHDSAANGNVKLKGNKSQRFDDMGLIELIKTSNINHIFNVSGLSA